MMAMSRILSQSQSQTQPSFLRYPTLLLAHPRHRSNKSTPRAHLIELDLDSSSSTDSPPGVRPRLEDILHNMMIRRAAPDWLPFLPGYSYWVPPRSARSTRSGRGIVDAIDKIVSSNVKIERSRIGSSEDERSLRMTERGWPSSAYFFKEYTSMRHIPVVDVVEVQVKIQDTEDNTDDDSNSEDEEV